MRIGNRLSPVFMIALSAIPSLQAAAQETVPKGEGDDRDRGLKFVWDAARHKSEAGEPVLCEMVYRRTARAKEWSFFTREDERPLALACLHENRLQLRLLSNCTFGYALPGSSDNPSTERVRIDLTSSLDLRRAGIYQAFVVDLSKRRQGKFEKGAPSKSVGPYAICSSILNVQITPPPRDLAWSDNADGLQCSIRRISAKRIELRLRNASQVIVRILPPELDSRYPGILIYELVDARQQVIQAESIDRTSGLALLRLLPRTRSESPMYRRLLPGEVHKATLEIRLPDSRKRPTPYLSKYAAGKRRQERWLRVRYDTRAYGTAFYERYGKRPWEGMILSQPIPLQTVPVRKQK